MGTMDFHRLLDGTQLAGDVFVQFSGIDSPQDDSVQRRTRLPLQFFQFFVYLANALTANSRYGD